MADFYAILGLSHTAEADDIAKAYRRAALTYNPECNLEHPDRAELERRFKLISQAYVVLANPKARAVYDVYGEFGVLNGGTGKVGLPGGLQLDEVDPGAVFRRFFGVDNPFQVLGDISGIKNNQHQFFSASAATDKSPPQVGPVQVVLSVSLEDVFLGATRSVTWTRVHTTARDETTTETVASEVTVPKGAADGTTLVLRGKGSTKHGMRAGDVFIRLESQNHAKYARKGDNLHIVVPISLVDALAGVSVAVVTIDGRELQVLIDEIVHPKYQKRLIGEGMAKQDGGRGDLVVECDIQFPKYLSSEQKTEVKRILSSQ